MTFDWSVVLICPAALQEKSNLLACALGHDVLPGNTFSVPLSADGNAPATHYGCHTVAQLSFVQMFQAAGQGQLPDIVWGDFGLTEADVWEVLGELIVSPRQDLSGREHFESVLSENSLTTITQE